MFTRSFAFAAVVALSVTAGAPVIQASGPGRADDAAIAHVLNRLTYGPRPGDLQKLQAMGVDNWVELQLSPSRIDNAALDARLKSLETLILDSQTIQREYAAPAMAERRERKRANPDADAQDPNMRRAPASEAQRKGREVIADIEQAKLLRAVYSERQLEEVLVDFWFNHFNVFAGKGATRNYLTEYERDAIRPYVLGNFRDLLGATAKSPAMLFYLDNWLSSVERLAEDRRPVGAPQQRANGVNENYARELLELHTLGVDGGYTQKDVTELARMLTGWTYDQRTLRLSNQTFVFDRARHDKGIKHWMGMEVKDNGLGEGEMALDVLAMHPSTAHHISYKLAQYFVQDVPPPALVDRMARMYLASKGDIRSVLTTLFSSQQFMAPEVVGAKFKTPYQFVVSASRASGAPVTNIQPLLGTMTQLGMPLYGCQTPDGWKNTQDAWLNPDALTRRITYATALAAGKLPLAKKPAMTEPAAPELNAIQLQATLGGAISNRTLTTVSGTAEPLRAAMLLGSPDFMQH